MGIARAACTYIALLHFLHGSNQICGDKKPLMVTSDVVNGLALLRMRMIIIVTIWEELPLYFRSPCPEIESGGGCGRTLWI